MVLPCLSTKAEVDNTSNRKPPVYTTLTTFLVFCGMSLLSLLIYLFSIVYPINLDLFFLISCLLTALVFIFIDFLKSFITHQSIYKDILETLLLGGIAAIISYVISDILKQVIHI